MMGAPIRLFTAIAAAFGLLLLAAASQAQNLAFPLNATPITASATGTTAATTATLAPSTNGQRTWLCGFDIGSTATAAAAGNATVTGLITGTMNFEMGTGTSPAVVHTMQNFNPCVPTNAVNTAIAVVSAAPGAGGVISVTAWGCQQ
jgi:hypothetical protein